MTDTTRPTADPELAALKQRVDITTVRHMVRKLVDEVVRIARYGECKRGQPYEIDERWGLTVTPTALEFSSGGTHYFSLSDGADGRVHADVLPFASDLSDLYRALRADGMRCHVCRKAIGGQMGNFAGPFSIHQGCLPLAPGESGLRRAIADGRVDEASHLGSPFERLLDEIPSPSLSWAQAMAQRCESQIERLFLLACFGERGGFFPDKDALGRRGPVSLQMQEQIGPFRADFVLTNGDAKLVVECDGREFHETVAARERDARRDKFLRARGFTVMRLTGSMLWNHPEMCASDAWYCLRAMARKSVRWPWGGGMTIVEFVSPEDCE